MKQLCSMFKYQFTIKNKQLAETIFKFLTLPVIVVDFVNAQNYYIITRHGTIPVTMHILRVITQQKHDCLLLTSSGDSETSCNNRDWWSVE